jgi:integrase
MNEIKELIAMGFTPEQIAAMNGENKTKKERKVKNLRPEDKKREGQRKTTAFDMEQGHVDLMLKHLKNNNQRLLFTIMVEMALRVSDVINLKVGDIRGVEIADIHIKKQKFNQEIEISDNLKIALEKYLPKYAKDSDYIFPTREKKQKKFSKGKYIKQPHITRQTAWNWISKAAERAGLVIRDEEGTIKNRQAYSCHAARKILGAQALKDGVNIEIIKEMYGHKDSSTTTTYLGITDKKVKDARRNVQQKYSYKMPTDKE